MVTTGVAEFAWRLNEPRNEVWIAPLSHTVP